MEHNNERKKREVDSEYIKAVGERIRFIRKKNKISANELTRIINKIIHEQAGEVWTVKVETLRRWERGENMPSFANLSALALALGCTISYLLDEITEEVDTRHRIANGNIRQEERAFFHGRPVCFDDGIWGIYNHETEMATLMDGSFVDVKDKNIFSYPQEYMFLVNTGCILSWQQAKKKEKVWVEVISQSANVRDAYRGWYSFNSVTKCFEGKTIFHESDYGSKYVAIEKEPE